MSYDVYIGGDGVGTFAGTPYAPDEVAKGLVQELQLRDGHTCSKEQIIEYLGKCGLGPLWATDVAMVLRNMFGVTPTFFEAIDKPASLLEELQDIVNDSIADEGNSDITDGDMAMLAGMAIESAFNNSKSHEEDAIIAALSMESISTIVEIAILAESLEPHELDEVAAAYESGGDALVEDWYEISFRPHVAAISDKSRYAGLAEAIGVDVGSLMERVRSDMKAQRRQQMSREMHMRARTQARADQQDSDDVGTLKKRTAHNLIRNMAAQDRPDPLAARAADKRNLAFRHRLDKSAAGMDKMLKGHGTSASGERDFVNKKKQQGQAGMSAARANPIHLPHDPVPAPVHPIKRALGAIGRIIGGAKKIGQGAGMGLRQAFGKKSAIDHGAEAPSAHHEPAHAEPDHGEVDHDEPSIPHHEPAHVPVAADKVAAHNPAEPSGSGTTANRPSLGQAIKSAGGAILHGLHDKTKGFRDVMKAKLRVKHPGLAYALHGAPKSGELDAAQHLGLHHHYARMGHELPGYRQQVHSPSQQVTPPQRQRKPKAAPRPIPDNRHPAFQDG